MGLRGFLLFAYIGDRFSEPSANFNDIAWTGIVAFVVFIPWTWWFDHHRALRAEAS